jgi:hypothetical protein
MSAELFDFRAKLTRDTRVWLEYKARRSGRDKQDIVREALHKIASQELHEADDMSAYAREQGLFGARGGIAGHHGARGGRR